MEWIKVTDSLPIENGCVLIVFINSVGTHVGQAYFEDFAFYDLFEGPGMFYKEVYPIVTHWMPLPDPPTL